MKKRLITAVVAALVLVLGLVAAPAHATNVFSGPCSNGAAKTSAVCQGQTKSNPLVGSNGLLVKVTHIVAILAGTAAVIIIIVSGFRFILSDGDSSKATTARNSLIYAVVGLVVVILAQSIISFVLSKL